MRGIACGLVLGSAFVLVAAGCGASSEPTSASIVALGDSVPRGTNCDCTPYPPLSADGLATTTGRTVAAVNDSVGGYTTTNVLNQLEASTRVIADVRAADAIEIEIGANDVAYSTFVRNVRRVLRAADPDTREEPRSDR